MPSPANCCQYCSGGIYFPCWLQNAWLTLCTCHICSSDCSLYLFTFWQKFAIYVGALGSSVCSNCSIRGAQSGAACCTLPTTSVYLPLLFPSDSWLIPGFPLSFRSDITSTKNPSLMSSGWVRCPFLIFYRCCLFLSILHLLPCWAHSRNLINKHQIPDSLNCGWHETVYWLQSLGS